MHRITGVRDPAAAAVAQFDDAGERRDADRAVGISAVGISAVGLALTGVVELVIALFTGSVGLLSDALHNLSDVSTSAVVFLGFRLSRRVATPRYPYGWERAEDLAGLGVALVVWASAAFAGVESVRKLLSDQGTSHVGAGIAAAAAVGIIGNQVVARYKLRVGRRIQSAILISDARHSWLDALSSAGVLAGLIGVAFGQRWADPVAGLIVTAFYLPHRLRGHHRHCSAAARWRRRRRGDQCGTHRGRGRGDTPCPRTGTLDRTHPARGDRRLGGSRTFRGSSRPARRSARPGCT